uniref:Uncharacterized protein n=1 Tax=Globodera rostochiensis TaxID=31243 RepID=A0A914I9Y4_GLORO
MDVSKFGVVAFAILTALALPGVIRGDEDDDCYLKIQHRDGTLPKELKDFLERFWPEAPDTTDCQIGDLSLCGRIW